MIYRSILPKKIEEIEIPKKILAFFNPQNKYVSLKDKRGVKEIAYDAVIGDNAEAPPKEDQSHFSPMDEYEFTNNNRNDRENALRSAKAVIKTIFGSGKYTNIKRYYMLGTSSTPIKILFRKNNERSRDAVFIKPPDLHRLVGRFFYDIISGIPPTKYVFNERAFIEEKISGNLLSKIDERLFLPSHKYRQGLMKAIAHADFLGVSKEAKNPKNRIINSDLQTILFDFNILFSSRTLDEINENRIFLLDNYLKDKEFIDDSLLNVYMEERNNIARRVEEKHRCFFKLAQYAGVLVDHTYKSINERIQQYYGAKNLEDYFEKKIEEYKGSKTI